MNSNWICSLETLNSDQNWRFFFVLRDPEIWWMTLENNRAPILYILCQALCIISNPAVNLNWSYSPETLNSGQNWWYFVPCDLEIWRMTLKNNGTSLLCCFKPCASFHSHHWIKTGVTVRKHPLWVKIGDFFVPCDLEVWSWMTFKTVGHLYYTTLSFVRHFKAISEFKLELQSENVQFGSKFAIFCPLWPWGLMDDLEKR